MTGVYYSSAASLWLVKMEVIVLVGGFINSMHGCCVHVTAIAASVEGIERQL